MITIIVFSHLRWNFVYQRPQQLPTRLATDHRILFVEEPVYDPSATVFEVHTPVPNIRVLNPHTQIPSPGFSDSQLPLLQRLLQDFLAQEKLGSHIVWFYTPMALPLSGWDVCLLPFACNAATRFISPTKTLEYMAAEKPIVNTPITDVAEPYGAIIYTTFSHSNNLNVE